MVIKIPYYVSTKHAKIKDTIPTQEDFTVKEEKLLSNDGMQSHTWLVEVPEKSLQLLLLWLRA